MSRAEATNDATTEMLRAKLACKKLLLPSQTKSSIWETKVPAKRHQRKLSCSKVGLGGASPSYPHMRGASPTREQRCKDKVKVTLQLGTLDQLWQIYVESSAWHQEPGNPWVLQNRDFVPVRKKIANLLRRQLENALKSDDLTELEFAMNQCMGRTEILAVQGNESFPDLTKVCKRIKEIQVLAPVTVVKTQSVCSRGELDEAQQFLNTALEAQDPDEFMQALKEAILLGADVSQFSGYIKVTSKYFDPAPGAPLFAESCFLAQKRTLSLLNLGPPIETDLFVRIIGLRGVQVKVFSSFKELFKPPQDRATRKGVSIVHTQSGWDVASTPIILQNPRRHAIWVISGPSPGKLASESGNIQRLLDFNKEGGALGLVGGGMRAGSNGFSMVDDVNAILKAMGLNGMGPSSYDGKRILRPQLEPDKSGFNARHPILKGIKQLNESFSFTDIDSTVLRHGYKELQRSSKGKLMSAIREPSLTYSNDAGPVILHSSPMQLLCSKESIGNEVFMTNLALYSCLRTDDVEEEVNFEGDLPEEEASDEEDTEDDDIMVFVQSEKAQKARLSVQAISEAF